MTDDERLERLLRSALRPVAARGPSRDLWPRVLRRSQAPVAWSWLDVSLAAVVAIVLLLFPNWLWLLAYHL
jgi:hypothetical protein